MMIHENYVSVVNAQNTEVEYKMVNCQACIQAIVNGDVVDKLMYNTQGWYLQPIHGLLSCYLPSYYANTYPKLSHAGANWTKTFGQYSLQRNTFKNFNLLNSMLNVGRVYNVEEIHLLCHLILYNLLILMEILKLGLNT